MYPAFRFEAENDTDYMVKGNAERMEQVLMNLINNAIKYSNGSKRVIVKTAETWELCQGIDHRFWYWPVVKNSSIRYLNVFTGSRIKRT